MARSSFYYHLKQSKRADKYQQVRSEILKIYNANYGRYGYRRIHMALKNKGYRINHKTVLKLMQELGLKSLVRIKKYQSYKGQKGKIVSNLLDRDFKTSKLNHKWATDITEFKVAGQKLYLSPIIDLFNKEIVSYQLSRRPHFEQVVKMLSKAFSKLSGKEGLILHSDQGWQYQMKRYRHLLKERNITQSMSRKGNCLDNAVIENFFGILKTELFYLKKYDDIEQLEKDIKDYICYYNNDRISLTLNGMSPIQYRAHLN